MTGTAGMPAIGGIVARSAAWIGGLLVLAVAAWYAATTLCAIVNFGFRQPMWDQWLEYETFLGLPFPQNVIQAANGHHPIFANLIRIAEIEWFAGNQLLQLTIGSLCAFLTALIVARAAWREREQPLPLRALGVLLAVLGLLWLGNARRLLHGSESLHGYLPTFAAAIACLCALRAQAAQSIGWLWAACAACAVATFSFGVGLAAFPGVVVILLLQRAKWRWLLVPVVSTVACLVLYLYVLPGDQGVRGQIDLDPLDGLSLLAQWIASPWYNGWLHYSMQVTPDMAPEPHAFLRGLLRGSATHVVDLSGGNAALPCLLLGALAIFAYAWLLLRAWRRGATPLELVAAGLGTYALAGAVITAFSRIPYFRQHPDQVFADRYMTWPTLFWATLALLALFRARGLQRPPFVLGSVLALLPLAMFSSQEDNAIWGALVYRNAQQTAAELRSGIYDAAHFPGQQMGAEVEQREIALLRSRRLAMFGDPAWQKVGTRWTGPLVSDARIAATTRWLDDVPGVSGTADAAHFEGWIETGIRPAQRGGQLAVLDDDDVVVGLAEYSFISPIAESLTLRLPRKRGFDGYIATPGASRSYRLVIADFVSGRARLVSSLPERAQVSGELQTTGNADHAPSNERTTE